MKILKWVGIGAVAVLVLGTLVLKYYIVPNVLYDKDGNLDK